VVEDRGQVGLGAVVYAGCRIGREGIVASNSYVVSDIPPGKLAGGVPARVLGNARHIPSAARQIELAERMLAELHEQLALRGHSVEPIVDGGFAINAGERTSHVLFRARLDGAFQAPKTDGETVVLTLGLDGEAPSGCSVLDLLGRQVHGTGEIVLDSVREFCRKRGIRFDPGPWRYRGGLL
jgi:hypothetical protein